MDPNIEGFGPKYLRVWTEICAPNNQGFWDQFFGGGPNSGPNSGRARLMHRRDIIWLGPAII